MTQGIDRGERQRHGSAIDECEREKLNTGDSTLDYTWCGHVTVCHCRVVRRATHTRCISRPSRSQQSPAHHPPPPVLLPSSSATLQVPVLRLHEDTLGAPVHSPFSPPVATIARAQRRARATGERNRRSLEIERGGEGERKRERGRERARGRGNGEGNGRGRGSGERARDNPRVPLP